MTPSTPRGICRPLVVAAVCAAAAAGATPSQAATRHYWISAESTRWDIVPNGRDVIMGMPIDAPERVTTAVVYRRYTPGWKKRMPNTARSADNDGIPGPLIEARVGDTVFVHFRNRDQAYRKPHSMHFHAFTYAPSSDGTYIPYVSGRGGNVPFGGSFTYKLIAGPQSAGAWPYHDHSSTMEESIHRGLYGPMVIMGRKEKPPDRRFVVVFQHMGPYATINGKAFLGNTPTFHAKVGDVVEWDVIALGENFHTFHVHGHRWLNHAGVPEDNRDIGPGGSFRVRWREDAPGRWYYHCHVESHQMNGMIGMYEVSR